MELFCSCVVEVLVALIDAWLSKKAVDAWNLRRVEPQNARFYFWLALLMLGLAALIALLLLRFCGYSPLK